jgi:hypothetical protein
MQHLHCIIIYKFFHYYTVPITHHSVKEHNLIKMIEHANVKLDILLSATQKHINAIFLRHRIQIRKEG